MKLYRYLCDEKKEFVLSKQIVRSGTSIGANVEEAIGWTIVFREEAEERRAGFPTRRARENGGQECPPSVARAPLSLFFDDLLDAKVREFNPRYAEAEGALHGRFRHLHTDIYGNRDFLFSPIVLHSLYDQDHYPSRTAA